MNQPNKLNRLIAELCPFGVEFRTIKDCFILRRGDSITKETAIEGTVPVIAGGQRPAYFINKSNRTGKTIVVSSSGAYAGYVSYWNIPIFVSDAFSIEADNSISLKFLYYFLKNRQESIHSLKKGGGVPHVHVSDLAPIRFPIPPLPIQEEIVRILDTFSEVVAELEAEQAARVLQYEHYRDQLLTSTQCKTEKFGNVAKIVRGASPRPIYQFITNDGNGINWIKIGDVNISSKYITSTKEKITPDGAQKSRYVQPGDFVLSNSMSFGRPYIMKTDGCIHDGWLSISEFEDSFSADFLYYLLSSRSVQSEFSQKASSGTVQNLNAEIVKSIYLPVPPHDVQERIVSILDRFDALVNDLKSGLPAEIALRRKQYEFYRDKLLTFQPLK